MKEVKKCSISGLSFTLDSDAWQRLDEYLESLKKAYGSTADGVEIIADIEARIAELILSMQDSARVVGLPLIESIIAQLGSAEDISEESSADDASSTARCGEPRIPRRLYRDMEQARLGGVCAGLAKYFDVEVWWVRRACGLPFLICILSCLPGLRWLGVLGGNLIWVEFVSYAVMWIAVPAARSARQKLEANGERITVRAIRDRSADERNNDVDSKARPVIAETITVLGRITIFILKLFASLIVFGLTLVALLLVMGLFVVLFAKGIHIDDAGIADNFILAIGNVRWIAVMGVLAVLLPTVMLLYVLLSLLLGPKPSKIALLIMFVLWIASVISLPVLAVRGNIDSLRGSQRYINKEYIEEHTRLQDSIDRAAEMFELPQCDTVTKNNYEV